MLEYHHYTVPTKRQFKPDRHSKRMGEIRDFRNNPYRISLIHVPPDSTLPETLKKYPHICFKVDNLDEAIKGKEIILPPETNDRGVKIAFTLIDGVNVEFIEVPKGLDF